MLAKYGTDNAGSVVVYKGQCKKTQKYSLCLHFAINAISTGLLAAGNCTMQALISSTKGEINKSHKNNDWVEIGVISFRNLRRISMDRVVLWWLLALSSVPLHLRFNSVVFTTVATNAYTGVVTPESFLVQPSYTMPDECTYGCNSVFGSSTFNDRVKYIYTHANSFKQLEKVDGIRACG
ncbi:hypothetical protein BDD12DRAFT_889541 [Trichophaea hybrida]|nr:hypothetical protein BDD12DRAFT_472653 [Trichophaea hybrida]KAF8536705.1 hypothetical protein BDD12DRAFT_889541 [Trichophaea hybrida]